MTTPCRLCKAPYNIVASRAVAQGPASDEGVVTAMSQCFAVDGVYVGVPARDVDRLREPVPGRDGSGTKGGNAVVDGGAETEGKSEDGGGVEGFAARGRWASVGEKGVNPHWEISC